MSSCPKCGGATSIDVTMVGSSAMEYIQIPCYCEQERQGRNLFDAKRYAEWQRTTSNYNTGTMSQFNNYISSSNTTWQPDVYGNYPQTIWHTFGCGHQIKLEPGQPTPQICEKCGPVKYDTHTYKCGHVYSYQAGTQVPAKCSTCEWDRQMEEKRLAQIAAEKEAEEERRREENKDVRVWLDRELNRVLETVA